MIKKDGLLLKALMTLLIIPIPSAWIYSASIAESTIINHSCTDVYKIPKYYINKAKAEFNITYRHSSHRSLTVSGMKVLIAQSDLYSFNNDRTDGSFFPMTRHHRMTWDIQIEPLGPRELEPCSILEGCGRNIIMCSCATSRSLNCDLKGRFFW